MKEFEWRKSGWVDIKGKSKGSQPVGLQTRKICSLNNTNKSIVLVGQRERVISCVFVLYYIIHIIICFYLLIKELFFISIFLYNKCFKGA